jgi:hypothetical protein
MQKFLMASTAALVVAGFVAGSAMAADITCDGKKLIIVDKLTKASKAKVVFVSKDQTCGITKGTSTTTDTAVIDASFDFGYGDGSTSGNFIIPAGSLPQGGDTGWKVNKATVAKFVNKAFPAVTGAKVAVIKPGKLLKIVGKTLGDTPIDIFGAGAPAGSPSVVWVYTVTNDGQTNRHCGGLDCSYKLIAADSGAKLVCKTPVAASCPASPSGGFLD